MIIWLIYIIIISTNRGEQPQNLQNCGYQQSTLRYCHWPWQCLQKFSWPHDLFIDFNNFRMFGKIKVLISVITPVPTIAAFFSFSWSVRVESENWNVCDFTIIFALTYPTILLISSIAIEIQMLCQISNACCINQSEVWKAKNSDKAYFRYLYMVVKFGIYQLLHTVQ